jgi:diguanylate cyclase (GGDEF)-like protein
VWVSAATSSKRLAYAVAASGYALVFVAFVLLERPGLGVGHFFYVPVCIVALASDEIGGALAGVLATAVYCLAVVVTPRVPATQALTTSTGIRLITFAAVGAVVGLYARRNRHLVERLRGLAETDFVTGVANARAFDAELNARCSEGRHFTLVLVDIDDLRRVNEVHGRLAGDAALRRVGSTLVERAGRDAFVARVGGDEFVVLCTLTRDDVPGLSARLNTALAAADVSVTLAATSLPADGEAADDLFRKADDRLFTAKLLRANRTALTAV